MKVSKDNHSSLLRSAIALPMILAASAYGQDADEGSSGSLFDASRFGIGLDVGTLGIGGHLTYDVNSWFYIKVQASGFGIDREEEYDDILYDGELDLFSYGISANFNPFHQANFGRGFRVTTGLFDFDLDVNVEASGDEVELDGTTYALAGSSVTGSVVVDDLAPYFGFGWDWHLGSEDRFMLSLDLGVFFIDSPEVDLTGTGIFEAGQAAADLAAEENSVKGDADDFKLFPLLQLSGTYKF